LAHSLALPCDCIRSLADRAPQEFYDLYPPAEQIAVAEEQQFPTDQNLTGLAWFSCKAEGAEYPIADAFTPYPKSVQQDLRRAYYASVSFTDHNIGQLLATVDMLGLTDELVVVFHADHGYQLGERNIYCKETNFNLAAHVPLIVRAPHYPSSLGTRVTGIVEIIDIMPTLIALSGLPALDPSAKGEPALAGRSLEPLLAGARQGRAEGGETPVSVDGQPPAFMHAYSQYARLRCANNLFVAKEQGGKGPRACRASNGSYVPARTYNGYSLRNDTHRFTRWTGVTVTGDPIWDELVGEEFYAEALGDPVYDQSERVNLAPKVEYEPDLVAFRAILQKQIVFPPDGPPPPTRA